MPSQGSRYPGTTATLANAGSGEDAEAWLNPGNIVSDNATEATITAATFDSPDISQLLVASNFGFAIPTVATIVGVVVEVERRDQAIGSASDNRVQLAKGTTFASLVGTNNADTALDWPTAATMKSYGTGTTDLWGTTWTPAEVNASSFAVMLSVQADSANTDVFVDYIRVTVHFTLPSLGAYPDAVIADNPVSYWRLGEGSGNPQDTMGPHHATSVTGTPTYGVAGAISGDTAVTTNAAAWFNVPDAVLLDVGDVFSVEFWFKRASIGYSPVMTKQATGGDALDIYFTSADELRLAAAGAGTSIVMSSSGITDTSWRYGVLTKNGATRAVYIDGVDVTFLQTNVTLTNTTNTLILGGDRFGNGFTGSLDEVALYNYALTSIQVAAHFAASVVAARVPRRTTYPQILAH